MKVILRPSRRRARAGTADVLISVSATGMTAHVSILPRRRGFTLVEMIVVIAIISALLAILLPTISGVKQKAVRLRCATNLRGIMTAMTLYADSDRLGMYPRAPYNPRQHLQVDNAGYLVPNTFGHSGYVGENNVPASLFLIYKMQHLPPKLFICPSTTAVPGFINADPAGSSNWERIPQNMTYSLAAPFPPSTAVTQLAWRHSLPNDFAVLADINPGTRGSGAVPNNVVGPTHDTTMKALMAANSNNHDNKGQNVAYGDGHVAFETSAYCGQRHPSTGIPDNIYTSGTGDHGICDDSGLPADAQDSVMMPTDDPGGK